MPNIVGERFQITIGKKVRDQLGIRPGDLAVERVENGRLVVTFVPRPHRRSQLGALRGHIEAPIEPVTDWAAAKERGWSARSSQIMDALRRDSERRQRRTDDE
jgi:AbrB family looped-hinge helix DNA binding protein